MNETIARFLSYILHPLLMTTYLFALLFYCAPEAIPNLQSYKIPENESFIQFDFKENLLFFIFIGTFATPASLIYYLYKIKVIPSLEMDLVHTRRLPYLFTFLLYLGFAILFKSKFSNLPQITICLLAISFSLFSVFVISFYWKISAHMVGISGVLGAIFSFILKKEQDQLFLPFIFLLILTGFIATARLKLNAHNTLQVIAGFILGLIISISITFIFI